MKILVTGGAGFIGFWLSRYLADQGHDITIIDNFVRAEEDEEFHSLINRPNVHFINGDIIEPNTLTALKDDFSYIYHLAMINGTNNFYTRPAQVLKVGILGTMNVLEWCRHRPGIKLLFSSSSETYAGAVALLGKRFPFPTPEDVPLVVDNPSNVRWSYGGSKILGEIACHAYAREYGLTQFTIVRYHNVYGPRMGYDHVIPQFIERILLREEPFNIYGGNETRTFIYIDDAVRATQLVMENPETAGRTIHIGRHNGEINIYDLAQKLFRIAAVNPKCVVKAAPEGSVKRRCPDVTKLAQLGFTPAIELQEGLSRCYDWYKHRTQERP